MHQNNPRNPGKCNESNSDAMKNRTKHVPSQDEFFVTNTINKQQKFC